MMPLNVNSIRIGSCVAMLNRLSLLMNPSSRGYFFFFIPMSSVSVHEMIIIFHRNCFLVLVWINNFFEIGCAATLHNSTPQLANVIAYSLLSLTVLHISATISIQSNPRRNRLGYYAKTNSTRRCTATHNLRIAMKLNGVCERIPTPHSYEFTNKTKMNMYNTLSLAHTHIVHTSFIRSGNKNCKNMHSHRRTVTVYAFKR